MYTDTMPEFRKIHPEKRNCYFPDEYKLHWHNLYSEPNCVTECTWLYAKAKCQCVPWFLRHFFEGALICELYGNRCFRNIMKSRNDILDKTGCSLTCLEDCHKYEFQSKRQFHKLERDCSLTEKTSLHEAWCRYVEAKETNLSHGLHSLSSSIRFYRKKECTFSATTFMSDVPGLSRVNCMLAK